MVSAYRAMAGARSPGGRERSLVPSMRVVSGAELHTLHDAVNAGHEEAVREMLRCGAAPDDAGSDVAGETPLHIAAERGLTGVVAQLLAASASPSARANDGCTPLHLAAHSCTTDGHVDIMHQLLLGKDGSWATLALNKRGETPMHLACKAGHLPAVEVLLGQPKEGWRALRLHDHAGKTPGDWAVERGHRHVSPLLNEWEGRWREAEQQVALDDSSVECSRWKQRALAAEAEVKTLRAQLIEQRERTDAEHRARSELAAAAKLRQSDSTSRTTAKQLESALDEIICLREQLQVLHAENAYLHQHLGRAQRWRRAWVAAHDVKRLSGAPATAPPHRSLYR
jgi:hypothetical protein